MFSVLRLLSIFLRQISSFHPTLCSKVELSFGKFGAPWVSALGEKFLLTFEREVWTLTAPAVKSQKQKSRLRCNPKLLTKGLPLKSWQQLLHFFQHQYTSSCTSYIFLLTKYNIFNILLPFLGEILEIWGTFLCIWNFQQSGETQWKWKERETEIWFFIQLFPSDFKKLY